MVYEKTDAHHRRLAHSRIPEAVVGSLRNKIDLVRAELRGSRRPAGPLSSPDRLEGAPAAPVPVLPVESVVGSAHEDGQLVEAGRGYRGAPAAGATEVLPAAPAGARPGHVPER